MPEILTPDFQATEIRIAAAVILDPDRRVLLVRKRGTAAFMQPGGKLEDGESPTACLARELEEELGLCVEESGMQPLGHFSASAANEAGAVVQANLFLIHGAENPVPAAEIAEAVWHDPNAAITRTLAPLTADVVLPLVSSNSEQAQ